jgi:FlaA1/EpsC-like NDP-sugar epimerase
VVQVLYAIWSEGQKMSTTTGNYYYILRWFFHLALFAASLLAAFLLRFDYSLPADQVPLLLAGVAIALPAKAIVFRAMGLHKGGWRYTAIADLIQLVWATALSSAAFTILSVLIVGPMFPRSVYGIDFLLSFLLTAASRCSVRLFREARPRSQEVLKNVLIYGAGSEGTALVREIRANPALGYKVVGFLDDSPWKRDINILGVPVLGTGREAAAIVRQHEERRQKIDEIVIAMPSADNRQIQEALAYCRSTGVDCKTMPGIGDLLTGKVLVSQLKAVSVTDLLGRAPVQIEEKQIREHVAGRSVLVTGAAGSIGSELCRQIASFEPSRLIVLDQAESELFRVDNELQEKFPERRIIAEIGDIRDQARIREVIREHSIDTIFHAAAYKHVPLMEAHPLEAVRNNIFGTWNLVQAAYDLGVERFLMISSDKAVRPSSVMGATKRVSELLLLSMPQNRTRFVSVRFGNVLGSNGSVIPLFQAQIDAGGPVTVTHPEMRRYFMTIPEAVQLVLLASTMGKGSEVFVLDMGEPVRIVDLARRMIRLAGRDPDHDIQIRFTGMRPGEKLHEELITEGENILPTEHEKIRIFQGPSVDRRLMEEWLHELEDLLASRDETGTISHLKELMHEYRGGEKYAVAGQSS